MKQTFREQRNALSGAQLLERLRIYCLKKSLRNKKIDELWN